MRRKRTTGTQPKTGFARYTSVRTLRRRRERSSCPSHKVRYQTEILALEALVRVRKERVANGDVTDYENHIYPCSDCKGFHLSSTIEHLEDVTAAAFQRTGEAPENYIRRLEARIAEQRAQLLSLQVIGTGASNRESRRRIRALVLALGRMTERWESERDARIALTKRVKALEKKRRWWR